MLKLNDWKDAPAHLQLEARAGQAAGMLVYTHATSSPGRPPIVRLYAKPAGAICDDPKYWSPLTNFHQAMGVLRDTGIHVELHQMHVAWDAGRPDGLGCGGFLGWEDADRVIGTICRAIVEAAGQTIN